jgi:hypothetical protein
VAPDVKSEEDCFVVREAKLFSCRYDTLNYKIKLCIMKCYKKAKCGRLSTILFKLRTF